MRRKKEGPKDEHGTANGNGNVEQLGRTTLRRDNVTVRSALARRGHGSSYGETKALTEPLGADPLLQSDCPYLGNCCRGSGDA
jgi:hypothetical protein